MVSICCQNMAHVCIHCIPCLLMYSLLLYRFITVHSSALVFLEVSKAATHQIKCSRDTADHSKHVTTCCFTNCLANRFHLAMKIAPINVCQAKWHMFCQPKWHPSCQAHWQIHLVPNSMARMVCAKQFWLQVSFQTNQT